MEMAMTMGLKQAYAGIFERGTRGWGIRDQMTEVRDQ
jgi:hypothetical protein